MLSLRRVMAAAFAAAVLGVGMMAPTAMAGTAHTKASSVQVLKSPTRYIAQTTNPGLRVYCEAEWDPVYNKVYFYFIIPGGSPSTPIGPSGSLPLTNNGVGVGSFTDTTAIVYCEGIGHTPGNATPEPTIPYQDFSNTPVLLLDPAATPGYVIYKGGALFEIDEREVWFVSFSGVLWDPQP